MLSLIELARVRPFLFHLTAQQNVPRIRELRRLDCATTLLKAAGKSESGKAKRESHVVVSIDGHNILIRDQRPLHRGNAALADGWSFVDLVECLNGHVFFWPGTERGPIAYGVRHFERYATENPAVLRVRTESLAGALKLDPYYCRFNSGSPRYNNGKASPRGPDTFVSARHWSRRASEIVEVTFRKYITLPLDTEVSDSPSGPWSPLA